MLPKAPSNAQKKQRAYYSGKKKRHTLKTQVVVNQANGQIICTTFGKGRVHDFRLFKRARIPMLPKQLSVDRKFSKKGVESGKH
ncbi:MAG: hypothetical protein N4J56_007500 [Chroococcidiopsis sp. SAG 2025]|uniref:transposase family protein n=1 Tax=Chroococcidiopsis sp. SAG 2025 TaxID=171389 RepID=UPI0029385BA5|nr:hypothetical protein [Chroococcidiopsis sp. SAG 2025]